MKWEQYKKLTASQKEEYDFRFKQKSPPPTQSAILIYLLMWMTVSVYIMAYYISYTSNIEGLVAIRPKLLATMETLAGTTKTFTLILVVTYIPWIFYSITNLYQERKWKKQNGVI